MKFPKFHDRRGASIGSRLRCPSTSPVADAAMNKDRDALRNLLKQKADVNAPQADGTTALHWVVRWDDMESVDLLLKAGANAQAANRAGATPMFLASTTGDAAMIEKLLKGGADANAPILAHGETALMMAARSGNVDAVKVLLDHGAQVNAKENLRGTSAHHVGRRRRPRRCDQVFGGPRRRHQISVGSDHPAAPQRFGFCSARPHLRDPPRAASPRSISPLVKAPWNRSRC